MSTKLQKAGFIPDGKHASSFSSCGNVRKPAKRIKKNLK